MSMLKISFFLGTHVFDNDVGKRYIQAMEETMDILIQLHYSLKGAYNIKIKLHPNERKRAYAGYNDLFGSDIEFISKEMNSLDVLADCVMALSWGSAP